LRAGRIGALVLRRAQDALSNVEGRCTSYFVDTALAIASSSDQTPDTAPVPRALIIAIDGPSGAGKGTVARRVAEALGYRHVDTGAMYRAVGWKARHEGVAIDDEAAVGELAGRAEMHVEGGVEGGIVTIDGHDVTRAIRTPEIDRVATLVARLPAVRQALVRRQRAMGAAGGVVMEGRDIGTVVFPEADVKIYLDASADERARRRANDPAHTGGQIGHTAVADAIAARDLSDTTRPISPLLASAEAVRIDTTGLSIEEVFDRVVALVRGTDRDQP
jgi:cytidylate kinase